MKRGWWVIAILLAAGSLARAKEEEKRSYFAFEMPFAAAAFEDEAIKDFFHQDYLPGVMLNWTLYPVRNLGIIAGVGGLYAAGHAQGVESGKSSGEELKLYVIPGRLSLSYRFDFLNEQVLVPSLQAGGDYWAFVEDNEFQDDVKGGKSGWHAGAGLGILLDRLEWESAFRMSSDFGIENVFLEVSAQQTWMNHQGLDFSGLVYSAGLLFEF